MQLALLWLLFSASFFSCKKDDPSPTYTAPVTTDSTPAQYGAPFGSVPDRQDVTMYQVNIRAFSGSGNFAGVIARLDSIKALGINVIYLMPIYPVGQVKSVNSPYAVKDYKAVNTEFGTLTDLRTLVDGAHSRGMSVILDWVANHTSWDNAWITAHKDWYSQDASGNIVSPSGYNDVAQLNFTNAAMRLTMIADMKYWVYTANVDGFRCDFADNPPADFWAQAIDTLRNISTHKLLMMAEGERSANFTAGFDYNFGFNYYGNLKSIYKGSSVTSLDNQNATEYTGASNGQQMIRYITNHDVNSSDGTPIYLFGGKAGSLAAFVTVALMKSVPMIYDGQEVGMTTPIVFPFTSVKIDWTLNPDQTAAYKQIIAFRNSSTAVRRGDLTTYNNADVCAFMKTSGSEKVLVLDNLRNATSTASLPSSLNNTTWTNALTGGTVTITSGQSLSAYQYLILKQ